MKTVALSARLRAVADMVTAGNRVCDVGCDHGFVPIWLVQQKISPYVLAMDVRSGPLGAAREHVAEQGLASRIETRLSDGLHNYKIGEADTLICAGMGGGLMTRILSADRAKTVSFRELILQPQSEVEAFRAWLRAEGYRILQEHMIEEDGKFYPILLAEPGADRRYGDDHAYAAALREMFGNNTCDEIDDASLCGICDRFGPLLLKRGDGTLAAFLRREEKICGDILGSLRRQGTENDRRGRRYAQVEQRLLECRMALEIAAGAGGDRSRESAIH